MNEAQTVLANAMTEAQLQRHVMNALKQFKWRTYHTFDSRKSTAGFPDIIAIRGDTGLAIELKRQKDNTKPERMRLQLAWLSDFDGAGFDTAMWRPEHWVTGEIERELMP